MAPQSLIEYIFGWLFVHQLLATLTTFVLTRAVLFIKTRRKRHQLFGYYGIPGPEPRLLDGNFNVYSNREIHFKTDQQLTKKYGKIYGIHLGDQPLLIVSDLDLLKTVFIDKMSSFKDRATFVIDTPLKSSIFFVNYNRWKLIRRIMSPTFSTFTMRAEKSTAFIENTVQLMLNYIEEKVDPGTKTVNIDMQNLMQAASLHLVSNMTVDLPDVHIREGEPNVDGLNKFLSSVDDSLAVQALRFPFLRSALCFIAKHIQHDVMMSKIHQGVQERINESMSFRAKGEKSEKLMDVLIKLFREGRLSLKEVIGNAEALLVAGYHTTSTALAYTFWVLGKHVDVQERLRSDLMAHGVESKYLQQVINEVMRLYPTVTTFTTRKATETLVLDSITIPQGTTVVFNAWLVHRDPDYWLEPNKFNPERFREGVAIHPCAFAPFGIGERICIGQNLANLALKVIICDLLLRYRLKTKSPHELDILTYSDTMSKPNEEIMIELKKLEL